MDNLDLAKIGVVEEQKLAYEQAAAFTLRSRHLKQLGLWAAAQMGKSSEQAAAYMARVLGIGVSSAADEDVVDAIHGDFAAHGLACDKQIIRDAFASIRAGLKAPAKLQPASSRLAA
jgi:hypothetical protein